jgi:hypothetical protein
MNAIDNDISNQYEALGVMPTAEDERKEKELAGALQQVVDGVKKKVKDVFTFETGAPLALGKTPGDNASGMLEAVQNVAMGGGKMMVGPMASLGKAGAEAYKAYEDADGAAWSAVSGSVAAVRGAVTGNDTFLGANSTDHFQAAKKAAIESVVGAAGAAVKASTALPKNAMEGAAQLGKGSMNFVGNVVALPMNAGSAIRKKIMGSGSEASSPQKKAA